MTDLIVRILERIHGHVGWLSALALAHPAVLLRRPRRNVLGVATAATVLVTLTASLGALFYPAYRSGVKPQLFASAPAVGALFERKEHLGIAALVLAWIGLAVLAVARRRDAAALDLGRVAFVAYTGAAFVALIAAGAGLIVGAHQSF
jgi:alpha-beta hydrolase superfamily lysophospholipase